MQGFNLDDLTKALADERREALNEALKKISKLYDEQMVCRGDLALQRAVGLHSAKSVLERMISEI
jgi:hypothetical protein